MKGENIMRLSMWILAKYLKQYTPQIMIKDGSRVLRNVRQFSGARNDGHHTVYVSDASEYFDSKQQKVICAHGHDVILLDTDDTAMVFNDIMDIFDQCNNWSDYMRENLENLTIQELLNEGKKMLGDLIYLGDPSFYVYAQASSEDTIFNNQDIEKILSENTISIEAISLVNQHDEIRRYNKHSYSLEIPDKHMKGAVRNLFSNGQFEGWLVHQIQEDSSITPCDMDFQDELGDIIERWMDIHQERNEMLGQSGIFLNILNGTYSNQTEIFRRLSVFQWNNGDHFQVIAFKALSTKSLQEIILGRNLSIEFKKAYTLRYQNTLYMIRNLDKDDKGTFTSRLQATLKSADYACGQSPVFTNIFSLQENLRLSNVAVQYAIQSDTPICTFEDAALPYCFSLINENSLTNVAHPAISILLDYDRCHKTVMYDTLKEFLNYERNLIKTATALHIHRSTLIYRIERIQKLTGLDLDDKSLRLHLMISYFLTSD